MLVRRKLDTVLQLLCSVELEVEGVEPRCHLDEVVSKEPAPSRVRRSLDDNLDGEWNFDPHL
jgi:hypothetical protein